MNGNSLWWDTNSMWSCQKGFRLILFPCKEDQLSEAGKMLDLITAMCTISTANQVSHRRAWQSNFNSMAVGGVPSDMVRGIINHTKLMPITTDVPQWLFHIFSRWTVVDIYAQNSVARYLEKKRVFPKFRGNWSLL